jgi:S-DNA-T family DNA segregation ATPase FtsK/SpoIIIE
MTTLDNTQPENNHDDAGATVYDLSAHRAVPALPAGPNRFTVSGDLTVDDAIEGEVLTPEQSAEVDQRLAEQARAKAGTAYGAVARVVRTGVTHERTRSAGRVVVRNAGYAVTGARIRRAERRARRKHLDLEQAIKTLRVNAKGAEDFAVLREMEDALERRRSGAADRGRARRIEILKWSGGVIVVLASGHVVLLGIAAVQAVIGAGSLTDRWHGMVEFWTTVADLSPVGGYWWAWAIAGAATWAVRSIPVGRAAGALPIWAADAEPVPAEGRNIIPDESAVLNALRHLTGLPKLKDAFKSGWGSSIKPTWIDPPYQEGKGWRMRLVLPEGVPVVDIVKRKTILAHNLVRLPVEVWPSEPKDKPGVLDLWVANQGALSGPVEDWPLLHEGTTDYFKGVPAGMNIRGDIVIGRLSEANYACAGIMGSGKSTLIITLVAGAILDPLVEVDVFVLAENADYDPFEPRLRTLRTGAGPETAKACLDTLNALYGELEVRGKALKEHGERKVTRKLAEKDSRLRPRVVVIDECQALFMDETYGEQAVNVVALLISAARKYAITLVFATPEPSTASLPRKVMAVTSCKACFAIGDQQSNDAVLGTGSYKAGISAVSLEPKTDEGPGDVGTSMVRGIMAKPGLMRSFYLRKDDEVDQVTPIVERALALREGYQPPARTEDQDEDQAEPDFLTDLARVLGTDKHVRTMVALSRLAELNAEQYGDWTSKTLKPALIDVHVPIRKSNGDSVIRADDITHAITLREQEDEDDDDDFGDHED